MSIPWEMLLLFKFPKRQVSSKIKTFLLSLTLLHFQPSDAAELNSISSLFTE